MPRPPGASTRRRRQPGDVEPAFRSRSEERVAANLRERGIPYAYEAEKVEYLRPARMATYTPDFTLENGVHIEVKGFWMSPDRQKLVLVKRHNPDLDVRFLFDSPDNPIYPGAKTTYGQFCTSLGVPWAKGPAIPDDWLT